MSITFALNTKNKQITLWFWIFAFKKKIILQTKGAQASDEKRVWSPLFYSVDPGTQSDTMEMISSKVDKVRPEVLLHTAKLPLIQDLTNNMATNCFFLEDHWN